MQIISVTRRVMTPFSINRLACAYIHQKTATPKGELFVSSSFPDNFDDPEFIAEAGKENKSVENTRKPTEKAAGSSEAAVKADRDDIKFETQSSTLKKKQGPVSEAEPEPRLDDM
ncbi:hypothetical protein BGW36DRAFT_390399 [Talaromyces proteolyticus]|uniref:Uncharacterized protein n=1 Tax=Talaromyces proteolyticus TaxID=1131652 RepID=A0AAD4KF86_9EURO|nr:uncharacterized protein BGW36DRAFT_390399 [Talaromyces proteolyticus]KAH8690224.1 hypothetical protein BGW36DRAFT_390399 [Talaromyces proteolyticus]